MKYLLLLILTSTIAIATDVKDTYLVTSHVPHDLEEILKFTKVVKNNGRVILVQKLNTKIPKKILSKLRKITSDEVINYIPYGKSLLLKDPSVEKLLSDLSIDEIKAIVSKLSSFKNRRSGSSDNESAVNYIKNEMSRMGLETEIDCFKKRKCNVYGRLIGTKKPEEVIVVEAHLDSVGRSYAGADDNASGIAGLLMIAKRIIKAKPEKSFIFFATNGEEQGLHGAKYFVKKMEKENKLSNIKFVINMDMIGYNESNTLIDIETDKKFLNLAKWMSEVTKTYTNLTPNITTPAWGSDHVPFIDKNIPTILTIEHWKTKTPCYHARCDLPDHLSYSYALEIIKLNIAASYLKSVN